MRPSATAQPTAAEAATQQARATSHAVRVDGLTTPTRTVDANPDGSYTLRQYSQPARKLVDDAWTDLDATLARQPGRLDRAPGDHLSADPVRWRRHHPRDHEHRRAPAVPDPADPAPRAGPGRGHRDLPRRPSRRGPPGPRDATGQISTVYVVHVRPPRPTRSCGP